MSVDAFTRITGLPARDCDETCSDLDAFANIVADTARGALRFRAATGIFAAPPARNLTVGFYHDTLYAVGEHEPIPYSIVSLRATYDSVFGPPSDSIESEVPSYESTVSWKNRDTELRVRFTRAGGRIVDIWFEDRRLRASSDSAGIADSAH